MASCESGNAGPGGDTVIHRNYYFRSMDMPGRPAATAVIGVTDARLAAAETLADLRAGGLPGAAFDRRTAGLDPPDHRWSQQLLYGILRGRGWLDAVLGERVRGALV